MTGADVEHSAQIKIHGVILHAIDARDVVASRVTVRVVAESSRREARVSKIRVPNKEYKRHESRRAGDEWSPPRTHCKGAWNTL